MTTIVGLHTTGKGTVMACDSQATRGNRVSFLPSAEGKIAMFNGWAVGCCGTLRLVNMVGQYRKMLLDDLDTAFEFTDRLKVMLRENDYRVTYDEDESAPNYDVQIMLANAEGIWTIDPFLGVKAAQSGVLTAMGSGENYAIGHSFATMALKDPVRRVIGAVQAAAYFDAYTGGEVQVFKLDA